MVEIKNVPMNATKSAATLGCPPGLKPDELTSCWHINTKILSNLNVSVLLKC